VSAAVSAALTVLGLVMLGAGFELSHRWKGAWGAAASLLAPLGVLAAAAGAVSLLVPGFFQ
jgi:hypothetical protein